MQKHRSQWPRGLGCGSAAAVVLGLGVRIPPVAWMSVSFECCVLLGKGLCDELISRPEESYRVRCVIVKSRQCGGLEPQGVVAPWEEKKWRRQQLHSTL